MELLPPAPNNLPVPSPNDEPAIKAYAQATAQADALLFNNQLAQTWTNYFQNTWMVNYQAGKYSWDANPSSPPKGFMVQTSDSDPFLFYFEQFGPLVCQIPAFTRIPAPPSTSGLIVAIGVRQGQTNFWSELPGDTAPDKYTTPGKSQDGVNGIFTKVMYPFGGWWEKVG